MDGELSAKSRLKRYKLFVFATFFMYISFIGVKNTFTAEIAMIMKVFSIDKPTASMTTTYYFFTYGIMQIILFFIMGKVNLKKFLTSTLLISAVLMFLVGFCNKIVQIYVLYAISGLTQAGIWSGIIAVFSMYLPKKLIVSANKTMSLGTIAGVISYGISAIFNFFNNWNLPFIILGAIAFFSVIFFYITLKNIETIPKYDEEEQVETTAKNIDEDHSLFDLSSPLKKAIFYISVLSLCFLTASIYFGVLNWIPSLMVDVFNLKESVSTLITIIVPLSTIAGPIVVINFCDKFKNVMLVGAVFFGVSIIFALILTFFCKFNLVLSLIVLIVFLNLANGAKMIFASTLPFALKKQINAGGFAAISNAFSSLGASFAPTIVGAVIENSGWAMAYLAIVIVDVVIVIMMTALGIWSKNNLKKQMNIQKKESVN